MATNDDRIEFPLPVVKSLGAQGLKTVRLRKTINGVSVEGGDAFRQLAPIPTVGPPDPAGDASTVYLQKNDVVLNWYPKVLAMRSGGLVGGSTDAARNQTHLTPHHVAFLDLDRLHFELERFKSERGWYNLNVTRQGIEALLADQSWYRLQIPEEELIADSFEKVRAWEEIALALLKKYTERYYTFRKREWELPHLVYRDLDWNDANFLGVKDSPHSGYRILVDESQEDIVAKLQELKTAIQKGELKPWEFRGMKRILFGNHLYQPLLSLDTHVVEISPAPLNRGERRFVEDLREFYEKHADYFETRELYLLRNLSRGRGVGFFEAGNFHPDFILWLLAGGRQHVAFVDPKGIRNLGWNDPKIRFCDTIKEIEHRLGDPTVALHSFIVSNTSSATMRRQWGVEEGRDAGTAHRFPRGGQGELREHDTEYLPLMVPWTGLPVSWRLWSSRAQASPRRLPRSSPMSWSTCGSAPSLGSRMRKCLWDSDTGVARASFRTTRRLRGGSGPRPIRGMRRRSSTSASTTGRAVAFPRTT